MTDRPTADRLALRPSAPGAGSVESTRPTAPRPPTAPAREATAHTPGRPADRPRRRLGRLVDAVGRRRTDRADRPATDRADQADRLHPESTDPTDRPSAGKSTSTDPRPTRGRPSVPRTNRPTREAAGRKDRSPTKLSNGARVGLVVVALLLAVVVASPIALSAQDLIDWAASPTGLGLDKFWATVVFIALDSAAAVCVLLMVYCAVRGEPAGAFGLFVWVFAGVSAFANYRHGSRAGAPADAWWFFPLMSILGPALMEMVLRRMRKWVQRDDNRRSRGLPSYGWRRWMPGFGSFRDTFGACRTAILLGIDTVDLSIDWYHYLCPDGSLRIVKAMRNLDITAEQLPRETDPTDPTKTGRPLPPPGSERVDDPADRGGHRDPWPTDPASTDSGDRPTGDRPTGRVDGPAPTGPTDSGATDRQSTEATDAASTDRPIDNFSNHGSTDGPTPTDRSTDGPNPADRESTGEQDPADNDKDAHTQAAVKNAATLRARYGNKVPPLADVRSQTKWSYDRAKNAIAAYDDRADILAGISPEPAQAGV